MKIETITDAGIAMKGTHNLGLVILSVVIAIVASYTALSLGGRVKVARRARLSLWLTGGAIAMGIGIWSMHFIAMLAYHLPIPMSYDIPIVLASMAMAVVASFAALFVVSRQLMPTLQLLSGGIFMGLGIAAMHYTGMAAMQLTATPVYDSKLVALSIAIAISASLIALRLAFDLGTETTVPGSMGKIGSAIVMGSAIAGMHYTAMAAVSFKPTNELVVQPPDAIDNSLLGVGIGIATLVILTMTLITSIFDQRIRIETASSEALRQSEERFRSLVQNSSDIIAVVAADGTVGYISPSVKRILGYEPENWSSAFELVHPDDLTKAESLLSEALRCPSVNITAEIRLRHADGQARDFEVIVNNLLTEPGVAGIVTTCRDITERKQTEKALRESEEKFRNLVEQTNDWIWKIDTNGVFTYVSPQVREIVGYEPAEILGKTTFDLMLQDELKRFAEVLEYFSSVHKPFTRLEKTLIHKDGHLVVLETSGSPIFDSQNVFQGYRGIARDITDRKWAEEEIKKLNEDLKCRTVELEATNKELEAFSYSVSHDLRAPLRAINGFSRILLNEFALLLAPEARDYLQMIRDNAQQMGRLIDDLLTFSRLSRSSLKKQLVHADDIVRQAIANLRHEQQNRHVEILLGDLPPVEADPALLKQVWVNLLSNALKYTRQRQVARIEVGCQQIGSDSAYFVKDNGVGFDMQYAHKLFGVFQRLHRAEDYEGTGVGLAIVQRIIHRHGGRVWASAEVNIGATLYFTIGGDIPHDTDCGRNPVSGRQSQRRTIDNALVEKQ